MKKFCTFFVILIILIFYQPMHANGLPGPQIEGPWVWTIASTGGIGGAAAVSSGIDYLSLTSGGAVTERQIATYGAMTGDAAGNQVWTSGTITSTGNDNITEMLNTIGLGGKRENHVAYGCISLYTPKQQRTTMYVGSGNAVKVWLNGILVHNNSVEQPASDYQKSFPVTLKKGNNILFVAVYKHSGNWSGFFGFEDGTGYNLDPMPTVSIPGPKIEGPWVWTIAPTGGIGGKVAAISRIDYLSLMSGGAVTERQIATYGAMAGDAIGNQVWTAGKISPFGGYNTSVGSDNINDMVKATGLGVGDINNHVAYGCISLYTPKAQKTTMYVGSDDAVKVWLNGTLVHNNPIDRPATDYQDMFPVTLKKGKNILLVAIYERYGKWSGFFGLANNAVYSLSTVPVVEVEPVGQPSIYWVNTNAGTLHFLVGAEVENLVASVQNATSLAVDTTDRKIYWAEQMSRNRGNIKSANLDGSNVQVLATFRSTPQSIAVDPMRRKLYWIDSRGRIQRSNTNGKQIRNLVRNLDSPGKIAVDVARGKLYWTEASGRIRQANLNGKNIRNIVDGLGTLMGISISGNKIYWTEITSINSGKIGRVNLNGSNRRTLVRLQSVPLDIAIDPEDEKLYWADDAGNIQRGDLNGRNIQNVVSGLTSPADLALGNLSPVPVATTPTTTPTKTTTQPTSYSKYDVNKDGAVNSADTKIVAGAVGQSGSNITNPRTDVDKDGTVDVTDLILVIGNLDDDAAAPAVVADLADLNLNLDRIQEQIDMLLVSGDRSHAAQRALMYLQHLLASARPDETVLLANYPNPFNPETWIPYHLATSTDVGINIYNAQGILVRALTLGHQSAGYYTSRSRAAYWDGRNALGERVASGIYFYQLETDEVSPMRKMVILK